MLFPGSWAVDSVWAGATPSYVATTLEDGRFDVSFLPSAAFHVVAVRDENRNYAWEPGEEVALLERQASSVDTASWRCGLGPRLRLPPRTCLRPCETTGAGRRGA